MREFLSNGRNLLFRRQTNILSAAFVIMATYGISHLVGLLKTRLLISYFFGSAARQLDVYYAAFVVPDTVFQLLIVGALSAAFIPTFSKFLNRNAKDAWYMTAVSMNLIIGTLIVISATIFAFASPICHLIAPGFNREQLGLMVSLLRIMLGAQVLFGISGFLTSIIQTHHRFLVPALAPVVYNLGIILGIVFLSPRFGIFGPAIGVVIGAALHMLIQLPLAFKLGFQIVPRLDFKHPGVREVTKLMPPRVLALSTDQVEQFVAVTLASLLMPGTLSLLNAARLLYSIPASLIGATIGQAAFPSLSQSASITDLVKFKSILANSLLQILFIALPISTLFIILRVPIVRIIFGARTFPWEATLLTGQTLAVLAVSASFYAIMQLVVRGFYALHDTRTPLFIGILAAGFNIVLSIAAVYLLKWNLVGIALGISLTSILETLVLLILLYKKLGTLGEFLLVLKPILKMLTISLVTGIGLWLPMRFLDQFVFDTTRTLPLLALSVSTAVIGIGVYVLLSRLFKVEQLQDFIALFKRLGQWRQILAATPEAAVVESPDA